jgi:hypothetical protein
MQIKVARYEREMLINQTVLIDLYVSFANNNAAMSGILT